MLACGRCWGREACQEGILLPISINREENKGCTVAIFTGGFFPRRSSALPHTLELFFTPLSEWSNLWAITLSVTRCAWSNYFWWNYINYHSFALLERDLNPSKNTEGPILCKFLIGVNSFMLKKVPSLHVITICIDFVKGRNRELVFLSVKNYQSIS